MCDKTTCIRPRGEGDTELLLPWVMSSLSPGPAGAETLPSCAQTPRQAQRESGVCLRSHSCQGLIPGLCCLHSRARPAWLCQAKEGASLGILPPDGGGKPALPLWVPPWSEMSRGLAQLPIHGAPVGSGNRMEGWWEGGCITSPLSQPCDCLPASSPPRLPLFFGSFGSPGGGERRGGGIEAEDRSYPPVCGMRVLGSASTPQNYGSQSWKEGASS